MVALHKLHSPYQNVAVDIIEPLLPVITEITLDLTGPEACMEAEQLLRQQEATGLVLQPKQSFIYFLLYRGTALWRGHFVFLPGKPRKPGILTIDFFDPEDGEPSQDEKKAALLRRDTRWQGMRFHILISRVLDTDDTLIVEG